MSKIFQDPRFKDVFTDPKFRILSKKERKFKIDKRFKKMLTDDKWKVHYTVDSRGRPMKQSSADHLEKFYDLSSDASDSEEDTVPTPTKKHSKAKSKKVETNKSPKNTTVELSEDSKLKKKKKANEKQAESGVFEQSAKVEGKTKKGKDDQSNRKKTKTSAKGVSGKKKIATSSWTVTQTGSDSGENSDSDTQPPMSSASGGYIDERFALPPGVESGADESEVEAESFEEGEEAERSDSAESESEAEKLEGEKVEQGSTDEESSDDGTLDRARGIGLESSSDEDEVASDWEIPNEIQEDLELGWAELDKDAGQTEEATSRLALCNVDWDRVQARDIFMLLKSFLPQAAVLQRVLVYPSDYGLERMKEEDAKGPLELQAAKDDDDTENENMLRQHQFNRLRYYYAIGEFDSPATAKLVYDSCNGTEYESTGNIIDLRFIPEDMTFEQEVRDKCEGEATKYKPLLYNNSSFKQTKVNSTWEEEDPRRRDLTTRLVTCKAEEIWEHMEEVEDLIAPPSSDEDDDSQGGVDDFIASADFPAPEKPGKDGGLLELFRQAVGKLEDDRRRDKDKNVDHEDTNKHGIQEDLEAAIHSKLQGGKKVKGKKLKQAQSDSEDDEDLDEMEGEAAFSDDGMPPDLAPDVRRSLGPAHLQQAEGSKKKRLRKKKKVSAEEEAAAKQEEASLALMTMGEEEEEGGVQKKHFSLRALQKQEKEKGKKKGRKRRKKELDSEDEAGQDGKDDFRMDVEDDRFAALYSKPEYNIDPTVPQYKATAGMQQIITKKIKKRKQVLV